MLRERVIPREVMYRNRSPKRSLRMPRMDPAKRLLVNCNHLASSPTKVPPRETLQDELDRKNEAVRHRMAKLANYKKLDESLKVIAVLESSEDKERYRLGQKPIERGKWSAGRDLRRLRACQTEWMGFKPIECDCPSVAVPIGCNLRLCPLCNAARLERYRGPARLMLEAMENPTFITLTVPNVKDLTNETFAELRRCFSSFFRSNKRLLRGGLYALETTHNREDGSFHPHIHVIVDMLHRMSGMKRSVFIDMKMMLEFAWLRTTSLEAKKEYGRNEYQRWKADALKQDERSEWNKKFRRVVDIRSVKGDSSAVYELIKYVSKTNSFIDRPEALATYLRAVRNVRVIQTFGSYFNFKMEVPMTKADLVELAAAGIDTGNIPVGAASFLECDCGKNKFKRIGVYNMRDVEMDEKGRWFIRPSHERRRCRGSSTGGMGRDRDGIY